MTGSPPCPAPGAENVQLGVRIYLEPDGDMDGLSIENPHPESPVWRAAATRAAMAAGAALYRDLTPAQLKTLADRGKIYFRVDRRTVCRQ